jgi:hypothetical protein
MKTNKRNICGIFVIVMLIANTHIAKAQLPPNNANWEQVFKDFIPPSNAVLPFDYVIDRVSVHQLKQDCTNDLAFCSFNPLTFDYKLYKSITMGDGNCIFSVSPTTSTTLLAV